VVAGILGYADTLHVARRYREQVNVPGSGEGDPRFGATIIAYNDKLIAAMQAVIDGVAEVIITDEYPVMAKLPPRGLRGVDRDPLIKKVADFPRLWPECPHPGAIFVRLSSLEQPRLLDQDGQPVSAEVAKALFRSGVAVKALFRGYPLRRGDAGVGLALNVVQYVRPGVRLGRFVDTDLLKGGEGGDDLFSDLDI
jgi:hypothetical protein